MTPLVLVCDAAHQPHHWTTREEAICLRVKDCLQYDMGDSILFRGGVSRMTGQRSQIEVGSIVFLKEVLKYDSRTPPLTNKNLFMRDRYICVYCGRHYPESRLSREHIIPTSKGGENTWMNTITACKTCNHHKGDRLLEETDMGLLYIPYTPNTAERLLLSNRRVLADQMEFLKQYLPKHSRLI